MKRLAAIALALAACSEGNARQDCEIGGGRYEFSHTENNPPTVIMVGKVPVVIPQTHDVYECVMPR